MENNIQRRGYIGKCPPLFVDFRLKFPVREYPLLHERNKMWRPFLGLPVGKRTGGHYPFENREQRVAHGGHSQQQTEKEYLKIYRYDSRNENLSSKELNI